ncbi:hypothetical protein [Roseivirga pacifica]|uniref:hypothetical protein n=1 Tax=Roseivirga pacifica TaxID=1267423 RepID=UPI00209560CA|nr:hypothetical protein [Roseivirga pacifica]
MPSKPYVNFKIAKTHPLYIAVKQGHLGQQYSQMKFIDNGITPVKITQKLTRQLNGSNEQKSGKQEVRYSVFGIVED